MLTNSLRRATRSNKRKRLENGDTVRPLSPYLTGDTICRSRPDQTGIVRSPVGVKKNETRGV